MDNTPKPGGLVKKSIPDEGNLDKYARGENLDGGIKDGIKRDSYEDTLRMVNCLLN